MILDPTEITIQNFYEKLPELVKHSTYRFLLRVLDNDLEPNQFDALRHHIIDKLINEEFECAEWQDRFAMLELVKRLYVDDMCGIGKYHKFDITDEQQCLINVSDGDIKTLVIPVDMFHDTDLAPLEIIVCCLKNEWGRSYADIARVLNRDRRTINTAFKRGMAKIENNKERYK